MWKQPIPTNLEKIFGKDWKCRSLFIELLLHASNTERLWTDERGKSIRIARGQVVFGSKVFSAYCNVAPATLRRVLQRLQHRYDQVSNQPSNDFTLVTIKNYDELVRFDQPNEQPMSNQRATNEQPVSNQPKEKEEEKKESTKERKEEEKEKIQKSERLKEDTPHTPQGDFIEWFNSRTGKKYQPTTERKRKIKARLKTFTLDELKRAAENRLADPWALGENEGGKVWAHDLDSLIRSDEKVDRWLNHAPRVVPSSLQDVPF